jgi:hypothetical protein
MQSDDFLMTKSPLLSYEIFGLPEVYFHYNHEPKITVPTLYPIQKKVQRIRETLTRLNSKLITLVTQFKRDKLALKLTKQYSLSLEEIVYNPRDTKLEAWKLDNSKIKNSVITTQTQLSDSQFILKMLRAQRNRLRKRLNRLLHKMTLK